MQSARHVSFSQGSHRILYAPTWYALPKGAGELKEVKENGQNKREKAEKKGGGGTPPPQ